jgi:hypothetical protein
MKKFLLKPRSAYKTLGNYLKIKINRWSVFEKKNPKKLSYKLKKNAIPINRFMRLLKKKETFLCKLASLRVVSLKFYRKCVRKKRKLLRLHKRTYFKRTINKKIKKRFSINKLFLLKRQLKIKNQLSLFLKKDVNLKMKNFLKSKKTSRKFKLVYVRGKKKLLKYKHNFFNKQFKEVYAVLSFGVFFFKAKPIVYLFSQIIGHIRFRNMKKTMFYIFNLIATIQKMYSLHRRIRLNISGKFKGKAKRTQLKYIKTRGAWGVRTVDSNLIDFHVGYVATSTGIFGIKL